MANNSVLRALSVLSLEDILKLSSAEEELISFQQVAGGEWTAAPHASRPQKEAKILNFPPQDHLHARDLEPLAAEGEEIDLAVTGELSMDFILTQRSLWKEGVVKMGLAAAIDSYLEQIQMISIKEMGAEGRARIRFISTQGLLINKKQS